MFILVTYDIPDNRRRTQVMKTLKNFGQHVQYSVFECDLNQAAYQRLREALAELVDKQQDNIRFYVINQEDVRKRLVWGPERSMVLNQPWYLVGSRE